ncbi:glycosyltransferase [Kiritimatiellota bacterium B12222]|nr:glycosyltransferase [Kiritimatiellota bacterium B12222]
MLHRTRILFYALDVDPERTSSLGIFHYTRNLLKAISKQPYPGFEIYVLTTQKAAQVLMPKDPPTWIRVVVHGRDYGSGMKRLWADHILSIYYCAHLNVDAVFFPKGWIPLTPIANCKVITTMHDQMHQHYRTCYPSYYSKFRLFYWRLLSNRSLKRSNCILTVSEFSRTKLLHMRPQASNAIHVVHEGPGIECTTNCTEKNTSDSLLVIGSRLPHKQTHDTLQRLDLYLQDSPKTFSVRVIGLNSWPSEWGPPPKGTIQFLGRVDDQRLSEEYTRASLLVFLSDMEGFGMPLLEALGHNTAICYRGGHAAEDIFKNIPGRWDGQDQNSFVEAMEAALKMNTIEIQEHYQRIKQNANWTHSARHHIKFMKAELSLPLLHNKIRETPPATFPVKYKSKRPLVILQLFNHYLKPGGEATSVDRIASHLQSAGHQVVRYHRFSAEWADLGAPFMPVQAFRMFRNSEVLNEIREVHDKIKPDIWVLHNIQPIISLSIYKLARELDVPIVQWLHNYRPISPSGTLYANNRLLKPSDPLLTIKEILAGSWRNSRIQTAANAIGLKWCFTRGHFTSVKAWVPVSKRMRDIFLESKKLPSNRIHTIRHAWDMHSNIPDPLEGQYFLFIGRTLTSKGIGFLIDLFALNELQDCKLIIAGDGEDRAHWEARSTENITWVGWVEQKQKSKLLSECIAVLFPSLWDEPLSTIAYEAYEHSKPLICSNSGGMPEVIVDKKTGFLLAPEESKEWIVAICRLYQNKEEAAQMGREGHAWLNSHVTLDLWNERFDEVISTFYPSTNTENDS